MLIGKEQRKNEEVRRGVGVGLTSRGGAGVWRGG